MEEKKLSVRILIADDHSMVREGFRQLLQLEDNFEVVGEAANGDAALDLIYELKPDVLLLDINMPIKNGLEVLEILKNIKTNTKVLMLTIHNEVEYLVKAVEIGCNGYLLKDSSFQTLKDAITLVSKGESYIQPELTPILNAGLMRKNDINETLTKRELEVLKLVAVGKINREIAAELDISERTVKNHISNLFKKIDVSDRTQAAVYAIKNDLIKIK